jgi:hypothetical protein
MNSIVIKYMTNLRFPHLKRKTNIVFINKGINLCYYGSLFGYSDFNMSFMYLI